MRVEKLGDIRMPVFSYGQAIDSDQLHHALDSLLSLARFGGQGFIRVAKASFLKHSFDPALRQRVLQGMLHTFQRLGTQSSRVPKKKTQPISKRAPTSTGWSIFS
jgi:hypothetical protein